MWRNPKVSTSFIAKLSYEYISGNILVVHYMKLIPVVCVCAHAQKLVCQKYDLSFIYVFSHTTLFSIHQREEGVAKGGGGSGGSVGVGGMALFSLIYSQMQPTNSVVYFITFFVCLFVFAL